MLQSVRAISLGWMDLAALYADHAGLYFAYGTPGTSSVTYYLRLEFPQWWCAMIHAVVWRRSAEAAPPDWIRRQLRR